jgi:uncharacterized repeat protein (TIGR01451 family)
MFVAGHHPKPRGWMWFLKITGWMLSNRISLFCVVLLAVLGLPQMAIAQITYVNTTDGTVNETVTPCTAPLSRLFNVPIHYGVADVNIGVVMSHTYRGDLRMFLTSPQGTQITLIQNTGTSRDNFNVLFDDSAAAAITTHTAANDTATAATIAPPYQRTFRPLVALSGFNGQDAFGDWNLTICDSLSADSGTFFHSTLVITPQPASLNASKVSNIVTDTISAANPKALPGATVRYCITINNAGPGIAASINANDILPSQLTYVPGSMQSGANCASAITPEDDNATGPDESDLIGASFAGATVNITRLFMLAGTSFSIVLEATVN